MKKTVIVVDDSPTTIQILKNAIETHPEFEVIATILDPQKALEAVLKHKPSVLTLDFDMPGLNGVELTRIIMEKAPTPILIVTGVSASIYTHVKFDALQAGAVDILSKESLQNIEVDSQVQKAFLRKLKIVSSVPVIHKRPPSDFFLPSKPSFSPEGISPNLASEKNIDRSEPPRIIAMGASTGGPPALQKVLSHFQNPFPLPIVLIQHIGDEFVDGFVQWLGKNIQLKTVKASQGEELRPGVVYVAPEGRHLTITRQMTVHLDDGFQINSCRPSVDRLFLSLAQSFGPYSLGVLLTGMGRDGAQGLKSMHQEGAFTIIQDEESSVIFGMPGAAYKLGAYSQILPLGKIGSAIQNQIFKQKK